MDLPAGDMKEFFETLLRFKVSRISFYNTNCQQSWLPTAFKLFHKHIGTTVKSVELLDAYYSKVVAVAADDTKIEVATADFGGEYISADDEVLDVEMEDIDNVVEV